MTSYELLLAGERLGAHTVEIKAQGLPNANALAGVANSTPRGTVQCFVGNINGEDDCELTPEEFSKRFTVTVMVFV